jgi:S-adenosylmethionine:tRNA ribosyltransferase-isomerase
MDTVAPSLKTEDFDYHLPSELIAQTPAEPRDSSRLMVVSRNTGEIQHRCFRDVVDYLRPGDILVCNESRVIPARLYGRKTETGGRVEALLIAKREADVWEALVKPGRRLRDGVTIEFGRFDALPDHGNTPRIIGTIAGRTEAGGRLIRFAHPEDGVSVERKLDQLGAVPLPPYIQEPLEDPERYQTVYARDRGSIAAPTAGLHFTPELMSRLRRMSIEFVFITLHVGLDTFRPVQVENVLEHKMHSEYCELTEETATRLNIALREGRRIVAVGTTSVRVLESAVGAASRRNDERVVAPFCGRTDIFIYPGYRFRAVDALVTNFHLPRSTLLMLVSAFSGKEVMQKAYAEAVARSYRFYSFGDAMLLC